MITWILVANADRATLYATNSDHRFHVVAALSRPASEQGSADFANDEPAQSVSDGGGPPQHQAQNSPQAPRDPNVEHFAGQLADRLGDAARRGAFERLVLVAPRDFLVPLRQRLEGEAKAKLVASLDKDYTPLDGDELQAKLVDVVATE
ncbi:MAG: host attachment protein [Pirellulales bacterium]